MTGPHRTTLVVTNDYPPRIGGIESFVAAVCRLLDDDVVVLTSRSPGWRRHDRASPHPVVRHPTRMLLPTPDVAAAARRLIERHHCRQVLFGASAPLGLLADRLRFGGVERVVALSHGHEVWWGKVPGTRALLRRIAAGVDVLGHISAFTAAELGAVLPAGDRAKLRRIPPPVDTELFRPPTGAGEDAVARVVAAGRFVPAKGWRVLMDAWHRVLARLAGRADAPAVVLELVGSGMLAGELTRRVARFPAGTVRLRGPVEHGRMPQLLAGARAFALPVGTRWPGLEPEGLGLVFVEAAACGIPVLAGKSGGTGDAVDDGRSGWLLDPADPDAWADHLEQLIMDPDRARRMGQWGRERVAPRFGDTAVRSALREALGLEGSG